MNRDSRWSLALVCVLMLGGSAKTIAQEPAKPAEEKEEPSAPAPSDKKSDSTPASTKPEAAKPDAPEVALRGYCPVSYHTDGKAMLGDAKHSAEYRGWVYQFADADKKKKFEEDPEKYIPRLGGMCVVALGGPYGNRFQSDPRVFGVVDGKLYLCSSERAKRSFDKDPPHYATRAEELYRIPELRGFCPVSIHAGSPRAGFENFRYVYRGVAYHLSSEDAVAEMKKNPEAYVPRYEAFCAYGVSQGKLVETDPTVAAVVGNRTYLFATLEDKVRCMSTEKTCVPEADAKWPELKQTVGKAPGGT